MMNDYKQPVRVVNSGDKYIVQIDIPDKEQLVGMIGPDRKQLVGKIQPDWKQLVGKIQPDWKQLVGMIPFDRDSLLGDLAFRESSRPTVSDNPFIGKDGRDYYTVEALSIANRDWKRRNYLFIDTDTRNFEDPNPTKRTE